MSNSTDREHPEPQPVPDEEDELTVLIWLQRTREERLAAFRRHP
ncbi:hypothetical protein [Streptomyces sp. NPDC057429]